jgi:hypothetical protein
MAAANSALRRISGGEELNLGGQCQARYRPAVLPEAVTAIDAPL